jgi:hypothetical protein
MAAKGSKKELKVKQNLMLDRVYQIYACLEN